MLTNNGKSKPVRGGQWPATGRYFEGWSLQRYCEGAGGNDQLNGLTADDILVSGLGKGQPAAGCHLLVRFW
ncbi:hypothetical protein [Crenothrix sp.]|uniref:hypothetical protein n=1 Tax=Crenothrix sp. TaxID=3100433 RepID=UPI00374CAEC1